MILEPVTRIVLAVLLSQLTLTLPSVKNTNDSEYLDFYKSYRTSSEPFLA